MIRREIKAPNGKTYTVEAPSGMSDQDILSQIYMQDKTVFTPAGGTGPDRTGKGDGFFGSLIGTSKGLASSARTSFEALTGDPTEAALAGAQRSEEIGEEYSGMASFDRLRDTYQEKGLGAAARQLVSDIPSGMGQMGPTLLTSAAGARAGAMLGGAAAGPAGAVVGGVTGGILANFPFWPGANIERQIQAQKDAGVENPTVSQDDVARAFAYGAAQSAAEGVGAAAVLGKSLLGKLIGVDFAKKGSKEALLKAANKSLVRTSTEAAGRVAVGSLPVDVAQAILERHQAGLPIDSDDAFNEYLNVGYISMGGSTPVAVGSSAMSRRGARSELERRGIDLETGEQSQVATQISEERLRQLEAEQRAARYMDQTRKDRGLLGDDPIEASDPSPAEDPADALGRVAMSLSENALGSQIEATLKDIRAERRKHLRRNKMRDVKDPTLRSRDSFKSEEEFQRAVQEYAQFREDAYALFAPLQAGMERLESIQRRRSLEHTVPEGLRADESARAFIEQDVQALSRRDATELEQRLSRKKTRTKEESMQLDAARVRSSLLNETKLDSVGLNRSTRVYRDLLGTDIATPEGQTRVREVMYDALRNNRFSKRVKEGLVNLAESPMLEGVDLQDVIPLTPETIPLDAPLSDNAMDALGLNTNTVLRKRGDIQRQDPRSEEGRANIVNMLEAFLEETSSDDLTNRIGTYLDRLSETPLREFSPEQLPLPLDGEGRSTAQAPVAQEAPVEQAAPAVEAPQEVAPETAPEVSTSMRPDGITEVHADDISVRGVGEPVEPAFMPAARGEVAIQPAGVDGARDPIYRALGIAPRSRLFRDDALGGRNLNDPADARFVRDALVDYLERTKGKVARENIPDFLYELETQGVIEALQDPATGEIVLGDQAAEDANNPNLVGSDAYNAARGSGDTAGNYNTPFLEALREGTVTGALNAIVDSDGTDFNPMEMVVAQRLLDSDLPMPRIRLVEQIAPPRPDGSEVHGRYDSINDSILLKRGEADSHTFLHEMVHAYTHRYLMGERANGYKDPHAKALVDLYAHTKRILGDRAEDIYGLTNVSEFVAEAMSNPDFQMDLMGVPYRKKTAWSNFVDTLKKLFGMEPNNPVDNVLFHALVHAEGLMEPGRKLQVDNRGVPVPNPVVDVVRSITAPSGTLSPAELRDVARAPSQAHQSAMKVFLTNFQKSLSGVDRVTRFRTKMVDSMASVEEKLNRHFDGGVRDAMGNINPINFLRQAADSQRIASRVFRLGGLRRDPETGWEAHRLYDEDGNEASPAVMIDILNEMAQEANMDPLEMKGRVATVLEGVRVAELRDHNEQLEKLAVASEELGTHEGREQAFKYRDKKVRLHLTNDEIDSLVDVFERSPQIQNIQRVLNLTRFNLIDNMVESGRLTEEAGEVYKSFVAYVPLDRVRDFLETSDLTRVSRREGLGVLGAIPELIGSYERPVANAIDNYMDTLGWMVGQIVRNDGMRRVLSAMEAGGFTYRISDQNPVKNANLVSPPVYIEGVPHRYQLESEFDLAAFAQSDTPDGSFIRGLSAISRILRATITAVPTFSLNMNIQDLPRAGMFAGTSSVALGRKILAKFPQTVVRNWRGTESAEGFALHNMGIVGNYDYNPINPLSLLEYEKGARKHGSVGRVLNRLEQIAKASDQATREAIYQQTMLETGDKLLATSRAREYINYNRRGASRSIRVLTKTVPFFNAYAQGLDIMYRGFSGRGASSGLNSKAARRYVAGRFAVMTLLGLAYASAMQDDEDYKNAPEYVRIKGWMLPSEVSKALNGGAEDYTPLVIPAPRELSYVFKTIPEKIFQVLNENARGEDRGVWEAVKDLLSIGRDTYLMQPIPPGIKQAIEYATNYSFFSGRELVPPHMKDTPTYLQVNRDTSVLAEELGKSLNLSPIKLDNALRNTFGTMGAFALRMSDQFLRPYAPELPMDKIPGLTAFVAPEVGNRLVNDFYDLKQRVDTAVAGANSLKEDPEQYVRFVEENAGYLSLKKTIDSFAKQLTEINKLRDLLLRSDQIDLSPAERRAELKKLDQLRQQLLSPVPSIRGLVVRGH